MLMIVRVEPLLYEPNSMSKIPPDPSSNLARAPPPPSADANDPAFDSLSKSRLESEDERKESDRFPACDDEISDPKNETASYSNLC